MIDYATGGATGYPYNFERVVGAKWRKYF
jgi:hypothetical protein